MPDTHVYMTEGHWYLTIWPREYHGRVLPLDPKKNDELFKLRQWLRSHHNVNSAESGQSND